jgi:hypothetical protein
VVLERSLSLLAAGRKAFILMRHSDALPACRGQRIPDARDAVTSDDADQASVAALSMNIPGVYPGVGIKYRKFVAGQEARWRCQGSGQKYHPWGPRPPWPDEARRHAAVRGRRPNDLWCRPGAENPATPRQPVRNEVGTYVLGAICYLCLRVGHNLIWRATNDDDEQYCFAVALGYRSP